MKKTLVLIFALFALVACNLDIAEVVETPAVNETDEIKLNVTITRADISPDTKATVKSGWADGDVVFLFFNSVAAPKYVALKRAGSSWTARLKNNMEESDLGASGSMTAVYLPYGGTFTVAANEGSFTIKDADGNDYCGHFYTCGTTYTYSSENGLDASISLAPAQPENASDKLVHFDVTGYTAGHTYALYQDYMKPLSLTSISADGTVNKTEGSKCDAIFGYVYVDATNSIVSFSGILDASAVGSEKDYQFSINDATASVLYTRDAGNKTLSANKYIGIGDISTSTWNANEYVYLGFTNGKGERVMWAKKNLGATVERGEGSYGKFYALGELTGYPLQGTYGSYTCAHRFHDVPTYELDKSHEYFWTLKPEYDAAHAELKGLWRIPTSGDVYFSDLYNLRTNTTWVVDGEGVNAAFIVSGKGEYSSASIIMPLAGYVTEYLPEFQGIKGDYWFSTAVFWYNEGWQHDENKFCYLYFSKASESPSSGYSGLVQGTEDPQWGQTIRPVFSIK